MRYGRKGLNKINRRYGEMTDCLFCKIAAGEIPAAKVYEDDEVLAFKEEVMEPAPQTR